MKSKQQTPLGYLMAFLDITLQDLADYLFVAQTSISKWKTGARTLKPDSQHFLGIVEYFTMLGKDPSRHAKLARLFAQLYPDRPLDSDQALARCIHTFLSETHLPSASVQHALGEEGRLYSAQISVFSADGGLRAAMSHLLHYISGSTVATLCIASRQSMIQLPQYLPALQGGVHICALQCAPPSEAVLSEDMAVYAHPGMEMRLLDDTAPFPPDTALYLADKALMLATMTHPYATPYAALYTDALTIEQYHTLFDNLWNGAPSPYIRIPGEQLSGKLCVEGMQTTLPTTLDWQVPSLPFLTMSRPLLMEVLKGNNVAGKTWTRILGCYDVLSTHTFRLLIPAAALHASGDGLPVLSLLCGKEVTVTAAQAKRHMLDSAALLRADSRLSIIPVQGRCPNAWSTASAYVKQNAFCGYLSFAHSTISLSTHPALVQAMMDATASIVAGLTQEARLPSYVAGLLERTALSL